MPLKEYRGVTYPSFLCHSWILWLWRKFMCPKNIHLLDECASLDDHFLSCDACNLEIHIANFDDTYVEKGNKNGKGSTTSNK